LHGRRARRDSTSAGHDSDGAYHRACLHHARLATGAAARRRAPTRQRSGTEGSVPAEAPSPQPRHRDARTRCLYATT
jgi:hypothetical protein